MTKAPEYWKYAEEALRGASESKSDKEKQVLIKLARLWSQAALKAEVPSPPSTLSNDSHPPLGPRTARASGSTDSPP